MSQQIQITGGAKVRNLEGVLTGTSGIVDALGINVPSGIPQLDGSGKILVSQLPNSVMEYKGTWDAATNTPTLVNGTGNAGDVYLVNVAGTHDFGAGPIVFAVGDQVLYSGTTWERASGATGTVTSVAVTESGDALTITGSPITTSGTINIGFAGTSGQYVNGAGGLTTFPSLTGYVPYTGATADVDLGNYGLLADYLNVNVPSTHTPTVGDIVWNSIDGTFDMGLLNGVTLQAGQELHFYGKASGAIGNGKAVMFAGVEGDHLLMSEADATTINANPQYFIGVATQDFANNDFGYVTVLGKVRGLDTTGYTLGAVLYYDSTSATDGLLTETMPTAPNAKILVAAVVRVHATQGVLMVRPHSMPKMQDIQDVNISSIADNQLLAWSTNRFENKSISMILGYTPANDSLVVHLAGTETITGTKTFSSAIKSEVSLTSKSIGTTETLAPSGYVNIETGGFSGYMTLALSNDTATRNLEFPISGGGKISYEFPSTSGILALTSDLSGYLPLSGGTLTGALNGTSATFSSTLTASKGTFNGSTSEPVTFERIISGSSIRRYSLAISGAGSFSLYDATADADRLIIASTGAATFSSSVTANGSSTAWGVTAQFGNSYGNRDVRIGTDATQGENYIQSYVTSTNAARQLSINPYGGNVLIGGTSSTNSVANLQVFGSTQVSTNNGQIRINDSVTTSKTMSLGVDGTNNVGFIQSFQDGVAYRSLILNGLGGNVGIGTSSPDTKLQVAATGSTGLSVRTDTSGDAYMRLYRDSTIYAHWYADRTNSKVTFGAVENVPLTFDTNATERMSITSVGTILFGSTSTPYNSALFRSSYGSNTYFSFGPRNNDNVWVLWNDAGTGVYLTNGNSSWSSASDERLKNIDSEISNSLEAIMSLRAVKYSWKKDVSNKLNLGLIAQDVFKVLPEAVDIQNDEIGTMGVRYTELVPVLVSAIQEQTKIINNLQERILTLESKLN